MGLRITTLALNCAAAGAMGQLCTAGLGDNRICHDSALGNKRDATRHESGSDSALGHVGCKLQAAHAQAVGNCSHQVE